MRVIIIEDELLTAEDLCDDLKSLDVNIQILAILPTVKESVQYLTLHQDYDLIFSDIQLGDGQSFEIFKQVKVTAPIIFCTAFNQYALEAFKTNGIDYILKPFDKNSIAQALQKHKTLKENFKPATPNYQQIVSLLTPQKSSTLQSLLVHQADKIIPILANNIAIIQLKHQALHIHTFEGQEYIIFQSLDEIESKISPSFYRVNRQFLVNRRVITSASQYFGRKLLLHLSIPFEEQLIVSREKTPHFLAWLTEN
jgi:two-component system, LytTR family, response regulator LytT